MKIKQADIDRFEDKFDIDKKSTCWLWKAGKLMDGYGGFKYKRKSWRAHRFSYLIYKGKINNGLFVCHHCDTKLCVNPEHLFLGTNRDNMLDMYNKGKYKPPVGEQISWSKLTETQVLESRKLYKTGLYTYTSLAKKYKVSRQTIEDAIKGYTWKHI